MPVASRRRTAIDLFAGAGGTGWGLASAGFTIVAAVDNDPHAAKTYHKNLGIDVTVGDISDVDPRALRRRLGLRRYELDVLVGCPPCQGFTRLRNEEGASDQRNNLILRYAAFVREFRPKYALFENVVGLTKSAHGKAFFKALLRSLRRAGYSTRHQTLEAADFGVPQLRKRVIVLASRGAYKIRFPTATHCARETPVEDRGAKKRWMTVRQAISKYPPLAAGAKNEQFGKLPNHAAASTGQKVRCFLKRVPFDGGSRRDVARRYWLPCHRDHDGHHDTYGRLAWDAPSGTITTGCTNPSKGRFVHPRQSRAITFREAAALQSFPDTFVFEGECIDRQIGNAVPPRLALALARVIRSELRRANSSRTTRMNGSRTEASSAPGKQARRVRGPGKHWCYRALA